MGLPWIKPQSLFCGGTDIGGGFVWWHGSLRWWSVGLFTLLWSCCEWGMRLILLGWDYLQLFFFCLYKVESCLPLLQKKIIIK